MILSKQLNRCLYLARRGRHYTSRSIHTKCTSLTQDNSSIKDHDREATIYVHWPYCVRRCTYCNFNKYISSSVDHDRMAECLVTETQTLLELSGVHKVNSVFFGGGTPSLALPSTIAKVINTIRRHVTFTEGSEVTLEANPTHLQGDKLGEFQEAGINRLSMGVQALNEADLKVLGRDHSVDEALRCLEKAKVLYPGHVSVDVIFGRPGQTLQQWQHELQQIVSICDEHVSLYQLTLERGTRLYTWVENGMYTLPDNDTMADMYLSAVQILGQAGLERYEVSNFARKGAESLHNQAYWQGKHYIGIGPGAHGRFIPHNKVSESKPVREARIQTLEPDNWMFEVQKFGHATRKIVPQTLHDRLEELISTCLRTKDGITNEIWSSLSPDHNLQPVFDNSDRVQYLIQDKLITLDDRGMRVTDEGMAVLDSIIPHLYLTMADTFHQTSVT